MALAVSLNSEIPSVYIVQEAHEIAEIKQTIKVWKEAIGDRFAQIRPLNGSQNPIEQDQFNSDRKAFEAYNSMIGLLRERVVNQSENQLLVAVKVKNVVQGIAVLNIGAQDLFIGDLVSAPWNIPMNALVPSEYASRVFKGAGKMMVLKSYQQAQNLGKTRVMLSPLNGSVSFYEGIGMTANADGKYSYEVSPTVPQKLACMLPFVSSF